MDTTGWTLLKFLFEGSKKTQTPLEELTCRTIYVRRDFLLFSPEFLFVVKLYLILTQPVVYPITTLPLLSSSYPCTLRSEGQNYPGEDDESGTRLVSRR